MCRPRNVPVRRCMPEDVRSPIDEECPRKAVRDCNATLAIAIPGFGLLTCELSLNNGRPHARLDDELQSDLSYRRSAWVCWRGPHSSSVVTPGPLGELGT